MNGTKPDERGVLQADSTDNPAGEEFCRMTIGVFGQQVVPAEREKVTHSASAT